MLNVSNLKFKIAIVKNNQKHRAKRTDIDRVLTTRVKGVITQDSEGNAYCRVTCFDKNGNELDGAFPFTKDSYDIKGHEIIFKRGVDSKGRKVCIIRGSDKAKRTPNDTDNYTTVRHNWLCDGNVILKDNKMMFRLHKVIKPFNNIKDDIRND